MKLLWFSHWAAQLWQHLTLLFLVCPGVGESPVSAGLGLPRGPHHLSVAGMLPAQWYYVSIDQNLMSCCFMVFTTDGWGFESWSRNYSKVFFLNNVKNATLTVDQLQMTLKSSSIEARKAIQSIQTWCLGSRFQCSKKAPLCIGSWSIIPDISVSSVSKLKFKQFLFSPEWAGNESFVISL